MSRVKIYIVTLFSGENELAECVRSVQSQIGFDITHEVIRDLPNREAHQELYRRFNCRRSEFDYLAKLDADMKFDKPDSLAKIISKFSIGVDIVSVTVWDAITGTDMQSFNVFSCRCEFDYQNNDPLFPDRLPILRPGRHVSVHDCERNVWHAFNPSDYQAFCFGVHRALKVVQRGARVPRVDNAYYQWRFIRKAYLNFLRRGAQSSYFATLGAATVFKGKVSDSRLYSKEDYRDVFAIEKGFGDMEPIVLYSGLAPVLVMVRIFGFGKFAAGVGDYVQRKTLGFLLARLRLGGRG